MCIRDRARDIAELNAEVGALEQENAALADKIKWQEMRLKQPIRVNGRPLEPEADPAQKDAEALIDRRYGRGVAGGERSGLAPGLVSSLGRRTREPAAEDRKLDPDGSRGLSGRAPSIQGSPTCGPPASGVPRLSLIHI